MAAARDQQSAASKDQSPKNEGAGPNQAESSYDEPPWRRLQTLAGGSAGRRGSIASRLADHGDVMALQSAVGNRRVVQLLADAKRSTARSEGAARSGDSQGGGSGMPNPLKQGIEALSGFSMDDVNVHYNSDKPGKVGALSTAEGTEIHVASGQEKHLPHEAWHVVQQKQGRVQATMQLKGVQINDDTALEFEATAMGSRAESLGRSMNPALSGRAPEITGRAAPSAQPVVQCYSNEQRQRYNELTGPVTQLINDLEDDAAAFFEANWRTIEILMEKVKTLHNELMGDDDAEDACAELSSWKSTVQQRLEDAGLNDVDVYYGNYGATKEKYIHDELKSSQPGLGASVNSAKSRVASQAETMRNSLAWIPRGKMKVSTLKAGGALYGGKKFKKDKNNKNLVTVKGDFDDWLQGEAMPENPGMNCWEAVLYSGVLAGVIAKDRVVQLYQEAKGDDDQLAPLIDEKLGNGRIPLLEALEQGGVEHGDVIFFGEGAASHVAISLGGNSIMSLWEDPGPVPTFQRTTITKAAKAGEFALSRVTVARDPELFRGAPIEEENDQEEEHDQQEEHGQQEEQQQQQPPVQRKNTDEFIAELMATYD